MRKFLVIIAVLLLIVSCASKPPKPTKGPGDLYVEGVNLMKAKKYSDAAKKFTEIRENFPFDPIAFVANVKLGDAYFEQKDYVRASGIYEEFFKAHPEDDNIPYVLLRLGQCYEKLSLSIDRDQAYTLKAIERYTYLKNRYPTSMFAKDVDERLQAMTQKLADRELYVGEFYFRTYQYNAAILRLEHFLKKYPGVKGTDTALFYLSRSYMEFGDTEKSDHYAEILRKEYPKSIYARAKIRERKSLKLAKASQTAFTLEEKPRRDIDLRPVEITKEENKGEGKKKREEDLSFFDETKPIDIVSDSMEGFEKGRYIVFKGNVVARQEDLYIYADAIEAHTGEETNEIEKAIAKGNVKIVKRERTATANEANFNNKSGIITLKGNVIVYSGTDRVTGELVTYYVNEDRVVVEGEQDKKARVIITPK